MMADAMSSWNWGKLIADGKLLLENGRLQMPRFIKNKVEFAVFTISKSKTKN